MAIQLQGNTGTVLEVETNTRALRVTTRPIDVGALGTYAGAWKTGTIAAGMAANGTIFSVRWTHASNLMLLRNLTFAMSSLSTAFTAGVGSARLIAARSFTASDSGGTASVPTGNSQKRRTSFGNTLIGDLRIASTGVLTAGTRTLDGTELSNIMFAVGTATNTVYCPATTLWSPNFSGEWPLVLAQDEGFLVQATVPATGTWQAQINLEWAEVASF